MLYSAGAVRELDRIAIEDRGVPGIVLMKRAGRSAFEALLRRWPGPEKITVYCGSGNNGGDGYIVAALAAARRLPVEVIQVGAPEKLGGAAREARDYAVREGVAMTPLESAVPPSEGVIVDALLGTGLKGEVRDPYATVIETINRSGLPVLAIDIPSGLCADSGALLGHCVSANLTVTFIGRKGGLYTNRGPARCGELLFDDLGVPADIYEGVSGECRLLQWQEIRTALPGRDRDAHKGLFGHVMVVGGDSGMGGAALMAAEAALRAGAGLVSVATRPEHVAAILARRPEVMAAGVISGQELEPLLERPDVLVVGPGLGQSPWSEQLLQKALAAGLPMLLDADALNILSAGRVGRGADLSASVITPHPGEAARLLATDTGAVQKDRFAAVRRLREKWGATTVLKGAGSLIASGEGVALCPYGNGGMAVGGMGDLLSGVIGSLMAQGFSPGRAAEAGVCLHAVAGDDAVVEAGPAGLCASDLLLPLWRRRNGAGGLPEKRP